MVGGDKWWERQMSGKRRAIVGEVNVSGKGHHVMGRTQIIREHR
jgi:hypothetical protein